MMNQKDYSECKNETAIRREASADVFSTIVELLKEHFGEDAVRQVGSKEVGFIVGTAPDKDGCPMDLCFTIDPTIKNWMPKERKVNEKKFDYEPYDLMLEAETYQMEVEDKEQEKIEKERKKQEKIKKDKAARAEAAKKRLENATEE